MNAGFSSLTKLKAQLLASSLRAATQYDDLILSIGRGVAKQFEHECNRKFERQVGATDIFQGDRASFILSRYPIERITAIDLQKDVDDGWQSQDLTLIQSYNSQSGVVYLADNDDAGPYWSQVRFTYTGGYWWDTSEDDSGVQPDGSALLHDDMILAWHIQCRHIWNLTDKLGIAITDKPQSQDGEKKIEMLGIVKDLINDQVRYQLT